jgi:hypothetical protein
MAAQHVAEAQRAVVEQREQIAALKHGGHDTATAQDALQTLLLTLDIARRDYERAEAGE